MKQFQDFDDYHHKIAVVHVGSATYEIWHQRVLPDNKIQDLAERIHQGETDAGKEPDGYYRHDFRDWYGGA